MRSPARRLGRYFGEIVAPKSVSFNALRRGRVASLERGRGQTPVDIEEAADR